MRVGVLCDLRNPPAWARPWGEFYSAALERLTAAESVGIDSIWISEHHGFPDGYMPQPLTFAAALATRTSRISIGTGIVIAPLHPAREIAEQAAVVDALSNGRLQLGLGAGYVPAEFTAFGVNRADRHTLMERRATEILELWAAGRVTPPPVQDEIPLWIGGFGRRAARIAGRLGAGLMWLDADLLPTYRKALTEGGHDPATARLGGLVNLVVADDPERTWTSLGPNLKWMQATYAAGSTADTLLCADGRSTDDLLAEHDIDIGAMRSVGPVMVGSAFDVVTAEEAVSRLTTWLDGLPATEIFFWDSIAAMPDEIAQRHIELLATAVAPALAGKTPQSSATK